MQLTEFPKLFQKTHTGAIQTWQIIVSTADDIDGALISVFFGQLDGKIQRTDDLVKGGKNTGKKNATTAEQQAVAEARSKWEKQKKKGYVEDIIAAQNDEVDATVVLGGISPMLAPNKSYPKDDELVRRIEFPCYAQPKLDGMRCIAVVENGSCTLWSRSRKQINTVPHIVKELEDTFPRGRVVLDGELYTHEYRNSFEDLISILRKDAPDAEGLYKVVEYHVYDCVEIRLDLTHLDFKLVVTPETPFKARTSSIEKILTDRGPVQRVATIRVSTIEELVAFYETCVDQEYEGAMARNASAPYEQDKRSKHLQKMKPFEDDDFPVIGVNEGRGKDAGTAATFTCLLPNGETFKARLKSTYAYRKELLDNPKLWQGKKLTVTLKRLTQDGIPYLPIGKALRDYEG